MATAPVTGRSMALSRGSVYVTIDINALPPGLSVQFLTGRLRGPTIWTGIGTGDEEAWSSRQPQPHTIWRDVVPPAAA